MATTLVLILLLSFKIAAHQESIDKEVTTPITTVPLRNPTLDPMLNIPNQDSPTITPPSTPGRSWCVAAQSAAHTALQAALDYACGQGGADCSAIQPGGACFEPMTLRHHASFAFNTYYHNNPIPTSCNFAASAITTTSDPSYGTCMYPFISTTSSVLNTTNSLGSRVFGAGPVTPSSPTSSTAAMPSSISFSLYHLLLVYNIYIFMFKLVYVE